MSEWIADFLTTEDNKMGSTILKFVGELKNRLKENEHKYHRHYDMMGDTEGGFYEQDDFDFEAMLKEIDDFSAEFKSRA